jgi:hypothetical protein
VYGQEPKLEGNTFQMLHIGRLLDLLAIVTLDWKGLPGTNTLAYFAHLYIKNGLNKLEYVSLAGLSSLV